MNKAQRIKLAQQMKVSPNAVWSWLDGSRNARILVARRLSKLTKTDVSIWQQAGSPAEHEQNVTKRRQALEKWAVKQKGNNHAGS
jgi:hypothetical protein